MSGGGTVQRAVVFAVFTALAAAGFLPLARGGPVGGVRQEELESTERALLAGARLHPAEAAAMPPGTAGFCAGCHQLPAHGGRRVTDAMANEHAARMDCLVCHWSAAAGPQPAPAWRVLSGSSLLAALPEERSSPEQLKSLRASVTAGRRCFERGPGCAGCHRPGGMTALARPGSGPAAALERLEDYFTLAPGEKWYFPQLK